MKAVCKGTDVDFTLPMIGAEAIVLSIGATPDRYCAEFGGTNVKNDATLLKRKDAGAPTACAAYTCGDGKIDPYEQCDAPGSSCGGAAVCDSNCQCPCDLAGCPCDPLDTATACIHSRTTSSPWPTARPTPAAACTSRTPACRGTTPGTCQST